MILTTDLHISQSISQSICTNIYGSRRWRN